MNIAGMNKAEVLAALYNAAKPQVMGFMHYKKEPMMKEEAQALLDEGQKSFDYLQGRVMKIDFEEGDELYTGLYNRDNGPEAAEKAIASLQVTGEVNPIETQQHHKEKTLEAAATAKAHLIDESELRPGVIRLGLTDVADKLGPQIEKVVDDLDK